MAVLGWGGSRGRSTAVVSSSSEGTRGRFEASVEATVDVRPPVDAFSRTIAQSFSFDYLIVESFEQDVNDDNVDDASDAWAAASWARTAITIKRVRATLQFEDEAQDAHSRMAKELSALAEVGFARMVRPHLPQAVVEDLYPR